MEIRVEKGQIEKFRADLIAVGHFEGTKTLTGPARSVDEESRGLIGELIESGDFEGKEGQVAVLFTRGSLPAKRLAVVGLGKKEKFDLDKLRAASAKLAQKVRDIKLKSYATVLLAADQIKDGVERTAQSFVEGVELGLYQFTQFKTAEIEEIKKVDACTIVEADEGKIAAIEDGLKAAKIITEATNLARDLISNPSNVATPTMLANTAQAIAARCNFNIKIMDRAEVEKLGMGAFLGVAKGSDEPCKFIILEQNADRSDLDTIALVGKGITFDSGGISLKPAEKMEQMKDDMSGGAAVMCSMQAASQLNIPLHIVGLIPATENLPSGKAYKPGDILKSYSGKTIEVINTDAEGRLILADALSYACNYKPKAIIDLATLTGACIIALGNYVIGLMGNNQQLSEKIRKASEICGERVWQLPLWEDYYELIKSDIADVKNTGGRPAGTITGAAFLSKFVGDFPWVHLDIAGPAWIEKDTGYLTKGATGAGVRLIVQFLRDWVQGA